MKIDKRVTMVSYEVVCSRALRAKEKLLFCYLTTKGALACIYP